MLNLLQKLLKCYADDEDVALPEDDLEEATDDDETPDENPDDNPDDEEVPEKPMSRAQKEIVTLRERAQKAEDQHRQAMVELESARRQPVRSAEPTNDQKIWQQEDAILANPESSDWQKYAVQSARDARMARQEAQSIGRESRDMADKVAFSQLAATKPKTHAAYKDRVESMLTEMRKNGHDAPRAKLFALLIGEDMISGKLKTTDAKSKTGGVKRGTMPGAKSDVGSSSSGKLSEAEKRAKRLENVRI